MSQPGHGSLPPTDRTDPRYWDLLEAAPDGILEVDQDGVIVLCNAIAAKIFGYGRDELVGMNVEHLVPPSQRPQHMGHRSRYWGKPQTRPMGSGTALAGVRKDGTEFAVEISLSPVHYPTGFRVIAVVRDVTERQKSEEKIRSVREQYTQELAAKNQELALRNQEVETANRLKSEFLASMSHELRTPLHTIIGFSELLLEELDGPLNSKQRRFLGHIKQDSQHLLEIINDILDLSKIEAGRLELQREEFDVKDAVQEVVSSIRMVASEKQLLLRCEAPENVLLYADRLRFKEILFNLFSNAVKFTPEHGRVEVHCRVHEDTLIATVSDTGIGIAREDHGLIFDKFRQVAATTKGVKEGTGLGLAITKKLVEMHAGEIEVESEIGKGATFTVRLPLDARLRRRQAGQERERPLILVVEDEPNASELLVTYLNTSGFSTAVASTAPEAIHRAVALLPDAITLDLLIPGGKGWRVISEIRSHSETMTIPIIVVSVLEEKERALQLGATDYLVKPVSREVLSAAVHKQVAVRKRARPDGQAS